MNSEQRKTAVFGLGILGVGALVRSLLFSHYPLFLTADSTDFLLAAEAIGTRFVPGTEVLRDWRLPGYPTFLAIIYILLPWTSGTIVLVQKLLGLGTVLLSLAAASRLGGRPGMVGVGLFVALHPGYLLQEHMLMSESLFVFLLWALVVACAAFILRRKSSGFAVGLLVGSLAGLAIMTRSNGLFLCLPLVVGALTLRVWNAASTQPGPRRWLDVEAPRSFRRHGRYALGVILALGAIWGSWILRNYTHLGKPKPFTDNVHRSRIVYLAQHDLLRPDLPEMVDLTYDPEHWPSSYDLMLHQLPKRGAEAAARRIVREQIRAQPLRYLGEVQRGARHFLGLPVYEMASGCRVMRAWFAHFVIQQKQLTLHNQRRLPSNSSLVLDRHGRPGRLMEVWRGAGILYLDWGRPTLAVIGILSLLAWVYARRRWGKEWRDGIIGLFGVAFASLVGVHAVLLADHDRYAVPFDGLVVLLIVTVWSSLWARARHLRTCRGFAASRPSVTKPRCCPTRSRR